MMKKRKLCICIAVVIVILCLKALLYSHIDPSEEDFLNVDNCPACFGGDLCPHFYHRDIALTGFSRLKYLKTVKNVFGGKYLKERAILKKLGHDGEIAHVDRLICARAADPYPCRVGRAMETLVRKAPKMDGNLDPYSIFVSFNTSLTDISQCPTPRLVNYLFHKLKSTRTDIAQGAETDVHKVCTMMYGFLLNPEAVIIQAFPQSEGWPFPEYYGSCGRVLVEEYVGKTISDYEESHWRQRLDRSYQLLLIAQMFTQNSLNFSLYMTDVNMENFAVRSDGTVFLIDLENIVIVDHTKNPNRVISGVLHHSTGEHCMDCLNFSFEDLCNHYLSDHNFYAVCKGLLAVDSYYSSKGLLHDMPFEIELKTNLSSLVNECANPSKPNGRFQVVPEMLKAMKSIL